MVQHSAVSELPVQSTMPTSDAIMSEDYAKWARQQTEWIEWVRQTAEWVRQQELQDKTFVLEGLSQAALLLGKLDEARQASEQSLKLLGEQPSLPRIIVLNGLGLVCYQQGSEKAQSYFEQARAEGTALGDWKSVAQAHEGLSRCALWQGEREVYWQNLKEAIQVAKTHKLPELERRLQTEEFRLWLERDATGELLQQQKQQGEDLYLKPLKEKANTLDNKLLVAAYLAEIDDFDGVEDFFAQAEKLAQGDPAAEWRVLREKANFYELQGSLNEAIKQAENALHKAQENQVSMEIGDSLLTLITLRLASGDPNQQRKADQEIEELRNMGKDENLAIALLARAGIHLNQKHPGLALQDIQEAETCRVGLDQRRANLTAKSGVLQALGRKKEALQVNKEAIECYREQLIPADGPSLTK
jgi:tetratricopeptide (TPR) repeat protein